MLRWPSKSATSLMGRFCPTSCVCQAMAYQMGASDTGKLDSAALQCRSHYPGNDAAVVDGAHRRDMLQEDASAVAPRSGMQDILGKRRPSVLQERHDSIAPGLGSTHKHFGLTPVDIPKLQRSQLLVAQSGRGEQEQNSAVPHARRCRRADRVDCTPHIIPWKSGR